MEVKPPTESLTKNELRFRMLSIGLIGILAGIIVSQVWIAIIYIPNINPYVPSNGNNGNNNSTSTVPAVATFVLVPFVSDQKLFHVGYDVYNSEQAIRFVVNVQEIAGLAGTVKIQFDIYTDINKWGTRENVGGIYNRYMTAHEIINDLEVFFVIDVEIYDHDAMDFSSAQVQIIS